MFATGRATTVGGDPSGAPSDQSERASTVGRMAAALPQPITAPIDVSRREALTKAGVDRGPSLVQATWSPRRRPPPIPFPARHSAESLDQESTWRIGCDEEVKPATLNQYDFKLRGRH